MIKEKGKTEEEEKATEKVIRVESEIEYRRDMPDSKTEVPAREVVGKKEKEEEKEEEEKVGTRIRLGLKPNRRIKN